MTIKVLPNGRVVEDDSCCTTDVPPVVGGQGRSAHEITEDGRIVGLILTWAFFLVVGVFVGLAL